MPKTDIKEAKTVILSFLQTYVRNAGCTDVVIGLSGGIDSATVAVLCKHAFGKNHVHCYFLPEKTTPKIDYVHKDLLCSSFGLPCQDVDITSTVNHITAQLSTKVDKHVCANIKARVRMTILYAYANIHGGLVCGTSNKSEILIGYCTKYGDGGVDIQPLGDLYKTQVYELARVLKIPDEIITKPPTAGLWHGQTDEQEIGCTYHTLDCILYGLEQKRSLQQIAEDAGVSVAEVKKIQNMRKQSEHKRHTPLIPKIGIRTPGFDWRSPVVEG